MRRADGPGEAPEESRELGTIVPERHHCQRATIMGLDICKNHAGRKAVGHCATCHVPLCTECALVSPSVPDQVFCCQEHATQFAQYKGRKGDSIKRLRRPSIVTSVLKLAVAAAIAFLVLHAMGWLPAGFRVGFLPWGRF